MVKEDGLEDRYPALAFHINCNCDYYCLCLYGDIGHDVYVKINRCNDYGEPNNNINVQTENVCKYPCIVCLFVVVLRHIKSISVISWR